MFIGQKYNLQNQLNNINAKIDTFAICSYTLNAKIDLQNQNDTLAIGSYTYELPIALAARILGQVALSITEGALITDFMPNAQRTNGRDSPSYRAVAWAEMPLLNLKNRKSKTVGFDTDTELQQLAIDGSVVIEIDRQDGSFVIGASRTTFKTLPSGDPATINRVADYQNIFFQKHFLYINLRSLWRKAVMSSGIAVPGTMQKTQEDAVIDIMNLFIILANQDNSTGVAYGLIRNDPNALQFLQERVEAKTKFVFANRSITSEGAPLIVAALESTIFTLIPQLN